MMRCSANDSATSFFGRVIATVTISFAAVLMAAGIVCGTWSDAYATISSPGTFTLVSEQDQNLGILENEQVHYSMEGQTLTVTGKTKLCGAEGLSTYYAFMALTLVGSTDGSIVTKVACGGSKTVHTFTITRDLSDMRPGIYRIRTYLPNEESYNPKNGKIDINKLSDHIFLSIGEEDAEGNRECGILQYKDVLTENLGVEKGLNAARFAPEKYLDKSLADMSFVLSRESGSTTVFDSALTDAQQTSMTTWAKNILKEKYGTNTGLTDLQKVQAFYEFAAQNIYYDNHNSKTHNNPFYTVKHIVSDTSAVGHNYNKGKVANVCTGYAATVIALCRSVGIPARLENGVLGAYYYWDGYMATKNPKNPPTAADPSSTNHHWAEVYVQANGEGQWIFVDATAASSCYYTKDGEWNSGDSPTSYITFCTTPEQISNNYIKRGLYLHRPSNVKLNSYTADSITVSCKSISACSGLHVRVCDASDTSKVIGEAYTTSTTKCTVTGLPASKVYRAYVCGYQLLNGQKVDGESTYIQAYTGPGTPVVKKVTPTTSSIKLTWGTAKGAAGYEVRLSKTSAFKVFKNKTLKKTATTCTYTGLLKGTTYYVKIRGYMTTPSGIKHYGEWTPVKTVSTKPAKVTIKTPATGSKYVKASWNKVTSGKGYQVQIATNSKFTKNKKEYLVTKNTILSKKISSLKKGKRYYVRVRAYTTPTGTSTKVYGSWSATKSIVCR